LPDRRKHRGPHPQDRQLFSQPCHHLLQNATSDLSWLLSRGYAAASSLKLVGDRYRLTARQRLAVSRCACSAQAVARRGEHQLSVDDLVNEELWIDGYNVITSIEAALAGGVLLQARDGCIRDMASMHGNYRKVTETIPAIDLIGQQLADWNLAACRWLFDAPVSNSGRLKKIIQDRAAQRHWQWTVELVADPDPILCSTEAIVASADSQIIDAAPRWLNLARLVIETRINDAWIVDLSTEGSTDPVG